MRQSTSCMDLATSQHFCGTLVGFVNPGFVGISLEDRDNTVGISSSFMTNLLCFQTETGRVDILN